MALQASSSTAAAAEGAVLRPQLGSGVAAGPRCYSLPPGSRRPDTDVAEQQLKGRAAGGATFEALPIRALKMYAILVKLSSDAAIATDLGLWRGWW